jgi:hypothetical protein
LPPDPCRTQRHLASLSAAPPVDVAGYRPMLDALSREERAGARARSDAMTAARRRAAP